MNKIPATLQEIEKLEKENERLNKLCEEVGDRLLLGVFEEKRLEKENRELKKYVCIHKCIHRNKGEYEDKHYICPQCENEETSESAKFCKICGLKIEKNLT